MDFMTDKDLVELRRLVADTDYAVLHEFVNQNENPVVPVATIILELLRVGAEEPRDKVTSPLLMARALAANLAASALDSTPPPDVGDDSEPDPVLGELIAETGDATLTRFWEDEADASMDLSETIRTLLEYADVLDEEQELDTSPGEAVRELAVGFVKAFYHQIDQEGYVK